MSLKKLRLELPHGLPGAIINSFVFSGHRLALEQAVEFRSGLYASRCKEPSIFVRTLHLAKAFMRVWNRPLWVRKSGRGVTSRDIHRRNIFLTQEGEELLAVVSLLGDDHEIVAACTMPTS